MDRAMAAAATVRLATSPRPWVGAVAGHGDGARLRGRHRRSGAAPTPRSSPCAPPGAGRAAGGDPRLHARAVLALGADAAVRRRARSRPASAGWWSAPSTPTRRWPAPASARLRAAGVEVTVGVRAAEVEAQLAAYLHQRRTGRPYVVLKLAATLDGRTAAPDRTSRWITGPEARADAHLLRAESDAVLVGAGTVRDDDPALTVRDLPPPWDARPRKGDPLRVVLGRAAAGRPGPPLPGARPARCRTCSTSSAGAAVVQLLVEGGAGVAAAFHRRRPRRPLRALPGPRPVRRRRRPRPVRGARERPRSATSGADGSLDVRRLGGGDVRLDLVPRASRLRPRRDRCDRHVAWCRARRRATPGRLTTTSSPDAMAVETGRAVDTDEASSPDATGRGGPCRTRTRPLPPSRRRWRPSPPVSSWSWSTTRIARTKAI